MVERQLPKLDVAGSIPVARSTFRNNSQTQFSKVIETLETSRNCFRFPGSRKCQSPEVKVMFTAGGALGYRVKSVNNDE